MNTLLSVLLLFTSVAGSTPEPRDLAPLLQEVRAERNVPALAGALIEGDRIAAIGIVGVRRQGTTAAATLEDRLHLGSLTKSMTATLAARLIEEERIAWDTTVGAAFAEYEFAMHEDWGPVTLTQLLQNRGGAPGNIQRCGISLLQLHTLPGTPREHRRILASRTLEREPVHPPGTKYEYSNAGYALAGAMLETATDTAWRNLMATHLFEPLGMKSAGFGPPGAKDSLEQPCGHDAEGKAVPGIDNPPALGPAGRVHCTVGDLAKYTAFHLAGARGTGRLLEHETFTRLYTPPPAIESNYAMGWVVAERPWSRGPVLTHAGSNMHWYAVLWIAPEENFAVVAVCNQGGEAGRRATDEVSARLIREHFSTVEAEDSAPDR